MQLDFFGIPMYITPGGVILAAFITFCIFNIHQMILSFKRLSPFKGDKLSNQSLFFIYMVRHDYFRDYQGFHVENKDEFQRKLWQVANILDVNRMQDKSYREKFQPILQRNHKYLLEAYELFTALGHIPLLKRTDVDMVVKRTHEILNIIILDINETFKDTGRPAA